MADEQNRCVILKPKPKYRRVKHPQTGRFMFAVDTERMIVLVVDRGKEAYIDLADLAETDE